MFVPNVTMCTFYWKCVFDVQANLQAHLNLMDLFHVLILNSYLFSIYHKAETFPLCHFPYVKH